MREEVAFNEQSITSHFICEKCDKEIICHEWITGMRGIVHRTDDCPHIKIVRVGNGCSDEEARESFPDFRPTDIWDGPSEIWVKEV